MEVALLIGRAGISGRGSMFGRTANWFFLLWVQFLGLGAGCGSSNTPPIRTEIVPYTMEQQLIREEAKFARYRIRSGDEIKLAFKYESELDQEYVLVLPDGLISAAGLPAAVKAAGLTLEELDEILTREYAKDIRNPEISVIIQKISDSQVYVLGEVSKPGLYTMPVNGMGVIQAIAMAGGHTELAQTSLAVVLRATNEGFMVRSLDLSHIEKTGFVGMEFLDLQPYDVIYVPRSTLGDFTYYSKAIFGSFLNVTRLFWDIYAIANIDKIDRIVR